jgi:hypothetical protein
MLLRRALAINGSAGEYRLNLARTLERMGARTLAQRDARMAAADPRVRESALALLGTLGRLPAHGAPAARPEAQPVARQAAEVSRNAPCPCGSGKRYKHCCGRGDSAQRAVDAAVAAAPGPQEAAGRSAIAAFSAGEALAAIERVDALSPEGLTDATTALGCADICDAMQRYERQHLRRANLGAAAMANQALVRICHSWYAAGDSSLRRTLRAQLAWFDERAPARCSRLAPGEVTIAHRGSSAVNCRRSARQILAPHVPIRLWSLDSPLPVTPGAARWNG